MAVVLIASLILVHFSVRANPMPALHPLDVDRGLPLPELAQASTVFSLTALFGAYLAIYLLLGVPALAGVACGSVVGLLLLRHWVRKHAAGRFEDFVLRMLPQGGNALFLGIALCAIQCAFATSEVLILREVAHVALGIQPAHAVLLAIGMATVGYFYVLFGGYMAVFRTDVLQFVLVAAMAIAFATHLPEVSAVAWKRQLFPRSGYWVLPNAADGLVLYTYHFFVGAMMGIAFLVASPDAWKRVFLVTRVKRRKHFGFTVFILAGVAPFAALVPFAAATKPLPNGVVNGAQIMSGIFAGNILFVFATLGLIASFLSAFNSSLIVSVHVGLLLKRRDAPVSSEWTRFYWLLISAFIVMFALFGALGSSANPYLLGNVLIGAYALVAGVLIGSRASVSRVRQGSLPFVFIAGSVVWLSYFIYAVPTPEIPSTYEINTVPAGVLLGILALLVTTLLRIRHPPR